jgi:hypothetical protein
MRRADFSSDGVRCTARRAPECRVGIAEAHAQRRTWTGRCGAWSVGWLALAFCGCAAPSFGDEPLDCAAGCADASAVATNPRELLLGRYAAVARFRAYDTPRELGSFVETIVALADFEPTAGEGVQLRWQVCSHFHEISSLVLAPITGRVRSPERLPARVFDVAVAGDRFDTSADPLPIGYEELSADVCPPGTKQSHPERSWLPDGQCSCPTTAGLPMRADDCRIVDTDRDGLPATTVDYSGATQSVALVRSRDASQVIAGQIRSDRRHRATYAVTVDAYQLSCSSGPCTRRSVQTCPAPASPVRFLPLEARADGEPWSCVDVVRDVYDRGLFGPELDSDPDC